MHQEQQEREARRVEAEYKAAMAAMEKDVHGHLSAVEVEHAKEMAMMAAHMKLLLPFLSADILRRRFGYSGNVHKLPNEIGID